MEKYNWRSILFLSSPIQYYISNIYLCMRMYTTLLHFLTQFHVLEKSIMRIYIFFEHMYLII